MAVDQTYVCCVLKTSLSFGASINTPVSLIETPRASPFKSSVRPLVSQTIGWPARAGRARKVRSKVVRMARLFSCLIVIFASGSYVLGIKRAGDGNLIGAADDGPRILKNCQFEVSGFEA